MEDVVDVSAVDVSADAAFLESHEDGFHEKLAMFKAGHMPFDGVELDLRPMAMMINGNLD
ncbi:hypothetical protein B1757_13730 [Acidithiobacillus marinus]|uniref:Uncharacterized protein n=1 Tax=Acidithiobacillus marinus TaxID=187490 RepID=A0A2I1DIG8_9PROT|nr:hypothetical protein [Acidithiobacillus marinus]PKY09658.1 hypothetical protein B1757_13730 [Acidithiobacillus marinus]